MNPQSFVKVCLNAASAHGFGGYLCVKISSYGIFQISLAYSRMVRSLEKMPDAAMLTKDAPSQPLRSVYS